MGRTPKPITPESLSVDAVMKMINDAEARRIAQNRYSATCYLRRMARLRGMTIEEYNKQLDARGTHRKYYPDGVYPPPVGQSHKLTERTNATNSTPVPV